MNTRAILLVVAELLLVRPSRAGGEPTATRHVLPLLTYKSTPDVLPGEPPSPEYPSGTVLVGGVHADASGPQITEWDLATGVLVQAVHLPIARDAVTLRMVRAGDTIHVLAQEMSTNIRYVTLTSDLQVEKSIDLEHGTSPTIATDGTVVAVQWCEPSRAPGLEVFDSGGAPVARHIFDLEESVCIDAAPAPLAVLGGHVYSLELRASPGAIYVRTRITRYDPSLKVEAQAIVEAPPGALGEEGILWAMRGHLLVEEWTGRPCRFTDLGIVDLTPTGHRVFRGDPLAPGVCPRPADVAPSSGGPAGSPIESGAQSHSTRGEDLRTVASRLFFRQGAASLLEFDRSTGVTWLTWLGSPETVPAEMRQASSLPLVAAPHVLALPATIEAPDAAPGQAPSRGHPRGTVFVAGVEPGRKAPTLSEWDLATGARLRKVDLTPRANDLQMGVFRWQGVLFDDLHMAASGDHLHVVARDGANILHFFRLTSALHVESDESPAKSAWAAGVAAGDGLVVQWWVPRRGGQSAIEDALASPLAISLRLMDSSGKTLGTATLPGDVHSVAVMSGSAYLVTETPPRPAKDGEALSTEGVEYLTKLDGRGGIEATVRLPPRGQHQVFPHLGALVLLDGFRRTAQALSPVDLQPIQDMSSPYSGDYPSDFQLAVGPGGNFVSTLGDVLSPDLVVQRHFATGPSASRVLWIGSEAAALDWRSPVLPTRLLWTEP